MGVDASSHVLDILAYACGVVLGRALISNENPNFEMPYNHTPIPEPVSVVRP